MTMEKIESKLFWINSFRNDLDKHNEFLVRFCSVILYNIDDLNKPYDEAFGYWIVHKTLKDLTVSVYSLNPYATKHDVAAFVRLLLANYIEDYKVFEEYLLTQIPEIGQTDISNHYIKTADKSCDELNDEETIDDIKKGIKDIEIKQVYCIRILF